MNKYIIFVISLITMFTIEAKAMSLDIVCPKDNLLLEEKIICDVTISTDISISTIKLDYDSDLMISFIENNNNLNKDEKNITVIYDKPLEMADNIVLFKMELMGKNLGISHVNFNNIYVNNDVNVNNISKIFSIENNIVLSSNNKLSDITIDGVSVKNFNANINRYENIIVSKPIVFIDVKGKNENAMVTGVGSIMIKKGLPTDVNIRVTSEDGNVNIYTLVIKYEKEVIKSRDTALETLELYNGKERLDFYFDKDKSSFSIKLNSDIEKVLVKAAVSNEKSYFIDGYGPGEFSINYGQNLIELRVESENGDIKIYSINIERTDNRDSNNLLKELIVNDIIINLKDERNIYEVSVPYEIAETVIKAVPMSNKAIVNYKNINLNEGNNLIKISVISENGKIKEYQINIIRLSEIKEELIFPDEIDNSNKDTSIEKIQDIAIVETETNNLFYYILFGIFVLVIVFAVVFIIKRKKKK